MRAVLGVIAAAVLVGVGFLLGRLPITPKQSPVAQVTTQPGAISLLDLASDPQENRPSISEQAAEALRRNEGGLSARNLRTLSEQPGAHPSLRDLANRAYKAGIARPQAGGARGAEVP